MTANQLQATCGTCKHARQTPAGVEMTPQGERVFVECWRYPPIPIVIPGMREGTTMAVPVVPIDECCGEWTCREVLSS